MKPGTVRDYVVLQEYDLEGLLRSLIPALELDEQVSAALYARIEEFALPVFVKVAIVAQVKHAPEALRRGGQRMRRPDDSDGTIVVPGVAVPVNNWSADDVRLTPKLDVEVGG